MHSSLDLKIRDFTENNIAPRALQQNALPQKVTERKPPGSVGTSADVKVCISGVESRSSQAQRRASYKEWSGPERRTTHLVVERERRNGVSYLSSTPNFIERAEQVRQALMNVAPESLRLKTVSEALKVWWEYVKEPTVRKERTREFYKLCLNNICKDEIGAVKISAMHVGHLIEFQQKRKAQVSVSYVNHETNVISQVLRFCDMWSHIGKTFRQLPPPEWRPPKVLTEEQEEHFFKVAASNPDWAVAYWAVSVTNNTSASGSELRMLQFKHVFIDGEWKNNPKIHVPDAGAKNQFRARVIPLNEIALKQIKRTMERARKHGAGTPDSYLFPKMVKRNEYDPLLPASRSFIRKAFKELREATGYEWLQPRNFRNQILTKLFENGTPDETIMAIAGHTSINMSRWYSQIRLYAKKDALSALVPKKKAVKNVG